MGVLVVGTAAQAPTNVEQGKEIVTLMPTVVAIWNVALTTVILPWDSPLIMTAVNQVRHFKAPKKTICVFRLESEFREKNKD